MTESRVCHAFSLLEQKPNPKPGVSPQLRGYFRRQQRRSVIQAGIDAAREEGYDPTGSEVEKILEDKEDLPNNTSTE